MGVAAYNRGTRLLAQQIDRITQATVRSNEARALLWRDLLQEGLIMFFRAPGGAVITVGPNKTATGDGPRFALYRDGGDRRFRGASFCTTPWAMAMEIIDNVGRARPYRVTNGCEAAEV